MTKIRSLMVLGKAMFCRSNLIGTDIEDVSAKRIPRQTGKDDGGVRICFTVSNDFLGKIMDEKVSVALCDLLP